MFALSEGLKAFYAQQSGTSAFNVGAIGHSVGMTFGAALFLIAVGAILRFAVSDSIDGIDLETVGLILIIVGVAGLVIGLFMMNRDRGTETVVRRDPQDPRY